ncbi:MAG: hypothetical protein ABR505_09420 [Actinomycetota bacterium]
MTYTSLRPRANTSAWKSRAVALSSTVLIVVAACSDGGSPGTAPETRGGQKLGQGSNGGARVRPPIALLYLEGTALVTEDLRGRSREFTDLSTVEVFPSATGTQIAYLTGSPSTVNLFTPATDSRVEIGPGVAPVWSPDGRRLAWVRPTEPCEGETCVPKGEVVVQEVGSGPERVVLEAGNWRILGWAGDFLHVVDTNEPENVLAVDWRADEEPTDLGIPLAEYWGASPNGKWLLISRGEAAEFRRLTGTNRRVRTVEGRLAEGAWAPDSSAVAAVLLGKESLVALLSPDNPELEYLPGSEEAAGNVVWSADSSTVAFARADPDDRAKLQAVYCEIEALRCRPLFSWRQGVRLLGFR